MEVHEIRRKAIAAGFTAQQTSFLISLLLILFTEMREQKEARDDREDH